MTVRSTQQWPAEEIYFGLKSDGSNEPYTLADAIARCEEFKLAPTRLSVNVSFTFIDALAWTFYSAQVKLDGRVMDWSMIDALNSALGVRGYNENLNDPEAMSNINPCWRYAVEGTPDREFARKIGDTLFRLLGLDRYTGSKDFYLKIIEIIGP